MGMSNVIFSRRCCTCKKIYFLFISVLSIFNILFAQTSNKKEIDFNKETEQFVGVFFQETDLKEIYNKFGKVEIKYSEDRHGDDCFGYIFGEGNTQVAVKFCTSGEFDGSTVGDLEVFNPRVCPELLKECNFIQVKLAASKIMTLSGLAIGRDEDWVLGNFGNPMDVDGEKWDYSFEKDFKEYDLYYGFNITFKNGKVTEFTMYRRKSVG
jgi:hypothetical protein